MSSNDYVVQSEFLHNNSEGHDKVYNVAIRTKGDRYEVVAEFGARTSILKQISKYTGSSLAQAREEYNKLIKQKRNKGYRVCNSDRSGRSTLANIPISGNNKTPAQLKKEEIKIEQQKQQDEDTRNGIPIRRLDFDDL